MAWRFNAPPGWPEPPPGWAPPPEWTPDPSWPPAPPGWPFWVEESGTQPAEPRRRRAGPFAAIVAAAVVIGLAAIAAVGVVVATRAGGETGTRVLETSADASSVRIENDCGSITVRPGEPGVVRTQARVTTRWRTPVVTSRAEGGEVIVDASCRWFGASVALTVEVPEAASVQARSSAGRVEASRLGGPLTLRSSAGSVSGEDLRSAAVDADSSAGSVTLSWNSDADAQRVDATSSAGSVTVLLPGRPSTTYRVDADSSAGSTTVEVIDDPSATRSVRAHSSAGSVTVGYQ